MPSPSSKKVSQLPRGPHTLSPEEVAQSQRERLFTAMVECVSEMGYAQTPVAVLLARSGVSRATFYQLFVDKEDCFCAAQAHATQQFTLALAASLQTEVDHHGDRSMRNEPHQRLEQILIHYLDLLASQPASARTFLVEVYAAGPRAIRQRQASLQAFMDIVDMVLRDQTSSLSDMPEQRFAMQLLAHGVSSMVTDMIGGNDTANLPELREPLLKLAVRLIGSITEESIS